MLQIEVARPGGSPVKLVGPVAKLAQTPAVITAAPPRLGEHSREILEQELYLSPEEIEELVKDNVVSLHGPAQG